MEKKKRKGVAGVRNVLSGWGREKNKVNEAIFFHSNKKNIPKSIHTSKEQEIYKNI
jgi:hypothetical protein